MKVVQWHFKLLYFQYHKSLHSNDGRPLSLSSIATPLRSITSQCKECEYVTHSVYYHRSQESPSSANHDLSQYSCCLTQCFQYKHRSISALVYVPFPLICQVMYAKCTPLTWHKRVELNLNVTNMLISAFSKHFQTMRHKALQSSLYRLFHRVVGEPNNFYVIH